MDVFKTTGKTCAVSRQIGLLYRNRQYYQDTSDIISMSSVYRTFLVRPKTVVFGADLYFTADALLFIYLFILLRYLQARSDDHGEILHCGRKYA